MRNRIKVLYILLVLLLSACSPQEAPWSDSTCSERVPKQNLPQHIVANDTILTPKKGRRIQINVNNPDLTEEECKQLINAYRKCAGPEGQVSVHKPDRRDPSGKLYSWCVDNMDDKGIFFNSFPFKLEDEVFLKLLKSSESQQVK